MTLILAMRGKVETHPGEFPAWVLVADDRTQSNGMLVERGEKLTRVGALMVGLSGGGTTGDHYLELVRQEEEPSSFESQERVMTALWERYERIKKVKSDVDRPDLMGFLVRGGRCWYVDHDFWQYEVARWSAIGSSWSLASYLLAQRLPDRTELTVEELIEVGAGIINEVSKQDLGVGKPYMALVEHSTIVKYL